MTASSFTNLLQILAFSLLLTQSWSVNGRKTYIVYMGEYPDDVESPESLHTDMIENVIDSEFATDALIHSYKSFNALVAKLTEEEARRIEGMEGVVSVIPEREYELQTSRSWDFIGFPETVQRRKQTESDIIIGVIDTGISPNSKSFDATGFGPPPQKWKGSCQKITCTNKIIGAKYFRMSGKYDKNDIESPIDTNGHGSHCASIAAGNPVKSTSLFGFGMGTVRGGASSAHIAVYKALWSQNSSNTDVLAAFDEAIKDGVDILSVSLGPREVIHLDYFQDDIAIGAFHALKKGILTSHAAGNSGPDAYTITNTAPWLLSVTATTIDRQFVTKVKLGNGQTYQGLSVLNPFDLQNKFYPLIYGGDAHNVSSQYNNSQASWCLRGSLDETKVKGKIVLCDTYPDPLVVELASGAVGAIYRVNATLLNDSPKIDVYALPAEIVRDTNNVSPIYDYLRSTSNPTATIFRSYESKDTLAPYIDVYSSRGPNKNTPNILKPDIAAPGTNILAAWSQLVPISGVEGDKRRENYKIISGTSMACPHATAAAAYVKSFHPNWSPAALKSALMTTASTVGPAVNGDTVFAYGAGQINPVKAVNPGLIYNITEVDYVNFLCGQGYFTYQLRSITNDNSICTQANKGAATDLNLASFALSTTRSTYTKATFKRTVTNVGSATSKYKATISPHPSSLTISVAPDHLDFTSMDQKLSFTVTIEGRINAKTVSSSLVWDDGNVQVRSPIVVYEP